MVSEEVFVYLLLLGLSLVPDEYVDRFWLGGLDVVMGHYCNCHYYCCDSFHNYLVYRMSYVVCRIAYVVLLVKGGAFARVCFVLGIMLVGGQILRFAQDDMGVLRMIPARRDFAFGSA